MPFLKNSKLLDIRVQEKYADLINVTLERGMRNHEEGITELIEVCADCAGHDEMVEIGCFAGESTEIFAHYFKRVYAIDCWLDSGDNYIENLFDIRMSRFRNIIKIKSMSIDAVKLLQHKKFDMVYIDGAHDYDNVKADIIAWQPRIKVGGLLAGHDYLAKGTGVKQVLEELFGKPDKLYSYTSWSKVL